MRNCPVCDGPSIDPTKGIPDIPGISRKFLVCRACEHMYDSQPFEIDEPSGIEYFDAARRENGSNPADWGIRVGSCAVRVGLCRKFAWAIPNEEALQTIEKYGPIVEIGAGGGYWAMLLRNRGVKVDAYDESPHSNHWVRYGWSEVAVGSYQKAATKKTLLLCWPYMNDMAENCLWRFQGKTIIYIGEHEGGCCATDQFFEKLRRHFRQVDDVEIPQWPGIHDYLSVWRRK